MKTRYCSFLLGSISLLAGVPFTFAASPAQPRNPQQLQSLDETPRGLAKSDWSSIRAAYETGRHAFQPVEGGWQARNPGQQWTTKFDRRGFIAQPREGGWQWGLELQSYGFGESQQSISGTPTVKAEGQHLSYQWDANVQEWFVNDQRGLEHGFTVAQRPAQASASPPVSSSPSLSFTLVTRGGLRPSVTTDAQGVNFQDACGSTVLNYSGLKVWDADGKVLRARFEPAGLHGFRLLVDETTARYPITIDPIAQQAYLKASNSGAGDQFGYSVAVSGNTAVIGAPYEDSNATGIGGNQADNSATDSGAAYIFIRSGSTWSQQAYLKASNSGAGDFFGYSVAVSGDTAVIGAWAEASNATGVGGNQADNSANESGAAYVFFRSGSTWTQQAYLKASNSEIDDSFGDSVAVSGDTAVIGAPFEDSNATGVGGNQADNSASTSGAAYVFTRSAGVWTQQAYLKASNTGTPDRFGSHVALSGDTAVIAAWAEASNAIGVDGNQADNSAPNSGAAYVFTRSAGVWSQQAYLKASNTGAGDRFGDSVALSSDTAVIGAWAEDSGSLNSGAAYVFFRSGSTWTQQAYLKASNSGAGDSFGVSVAVSGDTAVIGADQEDSGATGADGNQADNSLTDSGAAYVFTRSGSTWTQQAYLKASNTGSLHNFGWSVAMSGDTAVIGASGEASNATGVGGNQADISASLSGAAYTFPAPSVSVLGLTKTRHHDQTAAGNTALHDYSMQGFLEGQSLSGTFPSASNRFTRSGGGPYALTYADGLWEYEVFFSSKALLDAEFPNTTYNFLVGTSPAVVLPFGAENYPVQPLITASAGTWSGGRLLVSTAEAAAGFTLTSNVSNGNGFLTLEVYSVLEDILYEVITSNPGLTESITGTVPPGSLSVGQVYEVYTEFDQSAGTALAGQSWAAPGAQGYTLFSSNTRFEMEVVTAAQSWRQTYFGSTANSGNGADTFDFDKDGLVNLIEWACGLNPTTSSALPTPAQVVGGNIEFTYPRAVSALNAGAVFTVEWSDTLPGTTWSTAGVTQQTLSTSNGVDQVKATLPAGSAGRRFVHLKVTPAP
ncbi:MAG: FG-GAP repeat protein [Verrucomicrobiaceae bacterium]|nr:FG-GAP repeat protein [Verrucomicrobiaceae bacterium]